MTSQTRMLQAVVLSGLLSAAGAAFCLAEDRPAGLADNPAPADADGAASGAAATQPDLGRAIAQLKLDDLTLDKALDAVANAGEVNLFVNWAAIRDAGLNKDAPVTVDLKKSTIESALTNVLDGAAGRSGVLGFVARDGIVIVSTLAELGVEAGPPLAPDPAVLKALDQPIPLVRFDATGLAEAVKELAKLAKVSIVANWKALDEAGLAKESEVTLNLKDVPLKTALKYMLVSVAGDEKLLAFAARGAAIVVSTAAELKPRRPGEEPLTPPDDAAMSDMQNKVIDLEAEIAGLSAKIDAAAAAEKAAHASATDQRDAVTDTLRTIRLTAQIDLADRTARKKVLDERLREMREAYKRANPAPQPDANPPPAAGAAVQRG